MTGAFFSTCSFRKFCLSLQKQSRYGLTLLLLGFVYPYYISPVAAWALAEGGVHPTVGLYYTTMKTYGATITSQEQFSGLEFYQYLPNYGRLEGNIGQARLHGDVDSAKNYYIFLALRDYLLGRGKLDLIGGDQYAEITTFPVFFANTFYPAQYFRGVGLQYAHPAFRLSLLSGRVIRSRSFYYTTYEPWGGNVSGGSLNLHPGERLWLEANIYWTRNEQGTDGQVATQRNLVYRLASLWQLWQPFYLAGEFMQSFNVQPDNQAKRDLAYRGGAIWQSPRLNLEMNYRAIGSYFHFINNLYFPDAGARGYFLSGQASPWPFLGFSGSYSSTRNNYTSWANRVINDTVFRSAGLRWSLPPGPSFLLNYYQSALTTQSDYPVHIRGLSTGLYGELSWRWQQWEPYSRYNRYDFKDESGQANSYRRQSSIIGLRAYHGKISWYAEGQYDQYRPPEAGLGSTGLLLRLGANYYLSEKFSFFGELNYRPDGSLLGGNAGFNWQLPYDLQLRFYARHEHGARGVGDFGDTYAANQLNVQISKKCRWGQKIHIAGARPGQEWLGSGSIEGYVFEDLNLNHLKDPGEPGMAGVTVSLPDGTTTETDEQGYCRFPAVASGTTTVRLDARRIPASYTYLVDQLSTLTIQRRAKARVDFPFVRGVQIKGRVISLQRKGQASQGLPDVLVLVQPGDYNTFTDSEGYFAFTGLPPGTYEVSLHPESLPEHAQIQAPAVQTVTLAPGERRENLLFRVDMERPVLILSQAGPGQDHEDFHEKRGEAAAPARY